MHTGFESRMRKIRKQPKRVCTACSFKQCRSYRRLITGKAQTNNITVTTLTFFAANVEIKPITVSHVSIKAIDIHDRSNFGHICKTCLM